MTTITKRDFIPLTPAEAIIAGQTGAAFENIARAGDAAPIRINIQAPNGDLTEVSLPGKTLELIASVLQEAGRGRRVKVVAVDAELTTQDAAEMLNVSRPYLVKLLKHGNIPFRSVGVRRRILLSDLLDYKERESAKRHAVMEEMVAENQKLGLY